MLSELCMLVLTKTIVQSPTKTRLPTWIGSLAPSLTTDVNNPTR
jgi:hypothetical protein